jgi:exopolysaccharide biosynthesis polyprenyl glycosylphosphotransferase
MTSTIAPPRPTRDKTVTAPTGPRRARGRDPRPALRFGVDATAAFGAVALAGGDGAGALAFGLTVTVVNIVQRFPPRRLIPTAYDDVPTLALRALLISVFVDAAGLAVHGSSRLGASDNAMPLVTAALYLGLAILGRLLCYPVLRQLQRRRRLTAPALVVGTGQVGVEIATLLRDRPEHGLEVVGFADAAPPMRPERLPVPMLGGLDDLPTIIAEHGIRHVFVTFCQLRDAELVGVLRRCDRSDCEIYIVPRLFELGAAGSTLMDHLWGIPLVPLRRPAFRSRLWTVKRIFDVLFAATALVLLSPLLLLITLVLRREVGSPVLFRQIRLGVDGRPFRLLKFRTLAFRDAGGAEATSDPGPDLSEWSTVRPDRIGPVGRFLRRSSLDELPQLWNVLRGHMSLVGPRPEQPGYVAQFSRRHRGYSARLRVPAGLTGWAQIHDLRGPTSITDRVRFDNYYIEHWSLWREARIVLATVASVFGMRGS